MSVLASPTGQSYRARRRWPAADDWLDHADREGTRRWQLNFPFTKRLRSYLTDEQNALLASLPPLEPTIDSAIDGYLALARIFLPRARRLAERTGHAWPQAYEDASVAYFERSLGVQVQT